MLRSTGRGEHQTAYQVLVASSEEALSRDRGDLWDSGKVLSEESIQVPYSGNELHSHDQCFWKVRVWDQASVISRWSSPSLWSMGPLHEADWKAEWVGQDEQEQADYLAGTSWVWFPKDEPEIAAAPGTNYFRRVVVIPADRQVKRARFLYTGDNECRGWVNGRDIGARNNPHTVKDSDITYRLEPGTNILGLAGRNIGPNPKPAGVVAKLEIEFTSGEPLVIPTDSQWKVSDKEESRWGERDFNDSGWQSARELGDASMEPWGRVRISESRRLPARWLRKEFTLSKPIRQAVVYYSGLGLSELFLNDAKVGNNVLSPALSEYAKRVYYVSFDVTKQLQLGKNALGVVLGNGRFYADRSKVYSGTVSFGFPKLLLHLRVEHTDGSISEIVSDASWKLTCDGPILSDSEYDGETYDARNELTGWSRPGFDDSRWQSAQILRAPGGTLCAEMQEPIRVTQTLKPIAVSEPKPGVFIFDIGQNMVGWCRLHVSGPAGTVVTLRHSETLKADGTLYMANLRGALATDTYTLKGSTNGSEGENWEPRFTYHGFRYVEVTGFPGKPTLASIEGRVVGDDLKTAGEFACSNPLLNKIYHNVVWGTRGNYRSIPTDCPQRDERQGWLGDRSEESCGETYLFDNSALYAKWLRDVADSQKPSGSEPDVSPAYWPIYSDNVTWPSSGVIIPGMLYRQYGDARALAEHYDTAKLWIDYMLHFATNGLISRDSYGDWCVPPEDPALIHSKDPQRQTDRTLLATSYFYKDLQLMGRCATMLDKPEDASRFAHLAEEFKTAFNDRFLNRPLGQYDNGTQTSCVLPLAFGLVPDDMHSRIFEHLVRKITDGTKGHIGTGLIGGQYLNRVLSDNGRADLAYSIATQRDYPGWGYMVENGATTIWELWNGNTADPAMNSGNHVMLVGDLVIWFYEYLAGIRPDPAEPAFKHIIMKPYPVGHLSFVKATHFSPYGLISSEWRKQGEQFNWKISIPANTTATVYVPANSVDRVTESGKPILRTNGVRFSRTEGDRVVLRVGSGEYKFVSR